METSSCNDDQGRRKSSELWTLQNQKDSQMTHFTRQFIIFIIGWSMSHNWIFWVIHRPDLQWSSPAKTSEPLKPSHVRGPKKWASRLIICIAWDPNCTMNHLNIDMEQSLFSHWMTYEWWICGAIIEAPILLKRSTSQSCDFSIKKYVCLYVCIYVYVNVYVNVYVYVHVCTYVRTYVRMYTCLSVCLYLSISVSLHVSMSVCLYVCMDGWMDGWMDGRMDVYVCMHACIYGWMDVWMHACRYVSCVYVRVVLFFADK